MFGVLGFWHAYACLKDSRRSSKRFGGFRRVFQGCLRGFGGLFPNWDTLFLDPCKQHPTVD